MAEWFYDDELVRLRWAWVEASRAYRRTRDPSGLQRVHAAREAYQRRFDRLAKEHRQADRPERAGARGPGRASDHGG